MNVKAREPVHDNEEKLLTDARSGNRDAFDLLISRFEQDVFKTALFLTRNWHDAEDVAQEVYMRIYFHIDKCREKSRVQAWVYRITYNASYDLLRKRKIWQPLRELVGAFMPPDPVENEEFRTKLAESLARLTFQERGAFIFKEMHGLETEEVAEIMRCRPVTVRGYLHEAKKKLRSYMSDFREER
jgi:RNA polymerase sigma factor (sigma-70 family)